MCLICKSCSNSPNKQLIFSKHIQFTKLMIPPLQMKLTHRSIFQLRTSLKRLFKHRFHSSLWSFPGLNRIFIKFTYQKSQKVIMMFAQLRLSIFVFQARVPPSTRRTILRWLTQPNQSLDIAYLAQMCLPFISLLIFAKLFRLLRTSIKKDHSQ